MRKAIEWVNGNATAHVTVLIVTDSQSLCIALSGQNNDLAVLQRLVDECSNPLTIQWVPGHAGIEGNELADHHAKQAAKLPGPSRPVSFSSAKSFVDRAIKEKLPTREVIATAYSNFFSAKEAQITERDEQRCLSQMRSTHHKAFGDYQKLLHVEHVPTCHRCYLMDDSVRHFFTECPATRRERGRLFQEHNNNMGVLSSHTAECIALAKQFGVMSC